MSDTEASDSTPAPQSHIAGHVYSTHGAILSGARVTCNGSETITLTDGFYSFRELSPATYVITVTLQGYQTITKTVTLTDDERLQLDFSVPRATGTSRIHGRVYDNETKKSISNGTVILILPITNKYTSIDKRGHYVFNDLEAGTYRLSTSIPEYYDCDVEVMVPESASTVHDFYCQMNKEIEPAWG